MDEQREMDAAIQRGRDVNERSSGELAGREELIVTVTKRGLAIGGQTFRAYIDEPESVSKLIIDSQQAILDAAVNNR